MTDSDRLASIEEKIDMLTLRFDDFRVAVERRVTRLEVKAALWGGVAGLAGAAIIKLVVK